MPKLINTQTRIADLGKPRVIIVGGGFGGLEVGKNLIGKKVQTVHLGEYNDPCFQPFFLTKAFKPFRYNDEGFMATVGRNHAVADMKMWSYFSYDKSNRIIISRPKDGVH